jgi:REP element-mobilizing transposase RayT
VIRRLKARAKEIGLDAWRLERRKRFDTLLDARHGERLLADPRAASVVQDAFLHFDAVRYRLHAWCVMPNHVHVLATPLERWSLSALIHGWKSFTAKAINAELTRKGRVWAEEYFDRAIRDDAHFETARQYIEENPVKAGFCRRAEDWPFSSAGARAGRPRSS